MREPVSPLLLALLCVVSLHGQERRSESRPVAPAHSSGEKRTETTVPTNRGTPMVLVSRVIQLASQSAIPFRTTRRIESDLVIVIKAPRDQVYEIVADVDNKRGFFVGGRSRSVIQESLRVLPKNQVMTITMVDEGADQPAALPLGPPPAVREALRPRGTPNVPSLKVAIAKFEFRPPNQIIETLVTDPLADCLTCDRKQARIVYEFEPMLDGTKFTGKGVFDVEGESWTVARIEQGWKEFGNRLETLAVSNLKR